MVRQAIATIGLVVLAALSLPAATPAWAQFSNIFGNSDQPPRPPADVPPPPQQQQRYYPSQQQYQPRYQPDPSQGRNPDARDYPAVQTQAPQAPQPLQPSAEGDQPPAQPMPAPMSLPPAARPGGGTIESQPLAPPPGTAPSQQANTPNPNAPAPQQQQQQKPQQPQTQQASRPPAAQPQQQPQPGAPQAPAAGETPPSHEVVVRPPPQRITNPTAVFDGLDKITGRVTEFKVAINETVQFGALQVTPKACYSRPPTETPQTDAFVDVDEVTLQGGIRRIFTGWMFKSSPGLNAVEHPIYDVWLINCTGGKEPDVADASDNSDGGDQAAPAAQAAKPAARPARKPVPRHRPSAQSRQFLPAIR